jgi:hypothetical protein
MKTLLTTIFTLLYVYAHAQNGHEPTYYEQSGFLETPRYSETVEYCKKLDLQSEMISFTTFGKSLQGKALPLLILDRDGLSDPAAIHSTGRLIILIQACIHPGESEGKDAGLMLIRNFISPAGNSGNIIPSAKILKDISILFIPVFNVDGHERFGPYNRINQNGPKEMGWRTTASNLNLNRDYLKADTPEMQAWLTMFNQWSPDFFIDTHTTDGADYQYVLTYAMETHGTMEPQLTKWCNDIFLTGMEKKMTTLGEPVFPYVGFRNWHDPRSGLVTHASPPMLSQGYTAMRNRPGLLIETHMLKPYKTRVDATYDCILASLEILAREKDHLKSLINEADRFTSGATFLKEPFPLSFETSMKDSVMTDFLGFEYTVEKSDLTGGEWFHYSNKPVTFRLPYFRTITPDKTTRLPLAYIIPVEWKTVIERIQFHGIKMTIIGSDINIPVKKYRFINPKWQQNPYEGRHPMTNISAEEFDQETTFPAGSVIVELAQPAAKIIVHMLEPEGEGSFVYWGFFDAVCEQKEYGESYVIEKLAREMIAEDPVLKVAFEEKRNTDTNFAKNHWDMINWFYNRTQYADQKRLVYPVGKIYNEAVLSELLHR